MRSQELRKLSPEIDPLRLSMDWTVEELDKPQVLVEDTWGDALPGSYHLLQLSEMVAHGVYASGGKPALLHVTDMCDGIAQGWEGMSYSLLSREILSNMVEIHWKSQPFDGMVLLSSCDKGLPGQLISIARINDAPAIHVPGGVMAEGPDMFTLERVGTISAELKRGEISKSEFRFLQRNACPTEGCCSFMGTASTMQCMSEALGLALPTSAVMPAFKKDIRSIAEAAGKRVVEMIDEGLKTRDILTRESFDNAMMVHAAIGGSTNALLHIPTIAREVGVHIHPMKWDEISREIPFLVNCRPSGVYPAILFSYAGGVQKIISQIKDHLNMDAMTVTGKTLGDNLKELEKTDYFSKAKRYLASYKVKPEDVIATANNPIGSGSLAILHGNLAPEHAVIKYSAVPKSMFQHTGPAVAFENEETVLDAIVNNKIEKGSVIIIRNQGPKGCGMPELFYPTEALASNEELNTTTALVTDGRFSGASRGPCVGYVSPEAVEGGPIAIVENGDLIEVDIPGRGLNIVGINGKKEDPDTIDSVIRDRLSRWKPPGTRYGGVLGLYTSLATSAMKGGYIEYRK